MLNNKLLQILIPQYKETKNEIKPLLDSINSQRGIDFNQIGVIIVSDGGLIKLNETFLNSYNFDIKYHIKEHAGVSAARNKALELATAEYIMYCDADDCFLNCLALNYIINEINQKHFYSLYTAFLEELKHPQTGKMFYVKRSSEFVFVHGKVYLRQYLIDNNIKWNENLYWHEDAYFNGLALTLTPQDKLYYCDDPFYIWCWNSTSVCRTDPYFLIKGYCENIRAQDYLIKELEERGKTDSANQFLVLQIYQTFFINIGLLADIPELASYMKDMRIRINQLLEDYRFIWDRVSIDFKDNIYSQCKKIAQDRQYYRDNIGFDNWLKFIKEEK